MRIRKQRLECALLPIRAPDEAGADGLTWIQVLPLGRAEIGPNKSEILDCSLSDLEKVASLANAKKTPIPLIYEHGRGPRGGEAAGWFEPGRWEVRFDGLWGLAKLLDDTIAAVRDRKWSFISPGMWARAAGNVFAPTRIYEASLTNIPQVDGMAVVTASDLAGTETEDNEVDIKALAVSLNLSEDATEETIKNRIAELAKIEADEKAARAKAEADAKAASKEKVLTLSEAELEKMLDERAEKKASEVVARKEHERLVEKTMSDFAGKIKPAKAAVYKKLVGLFPEDMRVVLDDLAESTPNGVQKGVEKSVKLSEGALDYNEVAKIAKRNQCSFAEAAKILQGE